MLCSFHIVFALVTFIFSVTDPRISEPPSYPAFPPNPVDPFLQPVMPPEYPGHSHLVPTVKQEEYILGDGLPNGLVMSTGVMPPPAVPHSVSIPGVMVDSPMQEVQPQAESQVQPCISDLLSSPHMLPCEQNILLFLFNNLIKFKIQCLLIQANC